MATHTISLKNNFYIDIFLGKVLDYNQRVETELIGGHYAPLDTQSHTYTQIFIQDEQGKEHSFSTHNWNIPIRVGHELNVYALFKKGSSSGDVIAVKNINLNQIFISNDLSNVVKSFYKPFLTYGLIFMLIIPFILYFVLFVFIQPEPNSFIATAFSFLIGICQLGGLGSIIYGYHFRWRKVYFEAKKLLNTHL